jgi:hypothetical protein
VEPSIIIQALVQLPEPELQDMLASARKRAYRSKIEVEQLEEAIKVVAPGRARVGATRERILEYVREHGPVAPKQVIEFMGGAEDESIAPMVYNALSRMARDGELTRTDNGYEWPQPTQPTLEGFNKQVAARLLAAQEARRARVHGGTPRVPAATPPVQQG